MFLVDKKHCKKFDLGARTAAQVRGASVAEKIALFRQTAEDLVEEVRGSGCPMVGSVYEDEDPTDVIVATLLAKNAAYGNSALDPIRLFSKAAPSAQIRVRIDDKLSRIARGSAAGEDVSLDLAGYLILLDMSEYEGPFLNGFEKALLKRAPILRRLCQTEDPVLSHQILERAKRFVEKDDHWNGMVRSSGIKFAAAILVGRTVQ